MYYDVDFGFYPVEDYESEREFDENEYVEEWWDEPDRYDFD